MKELSVEEKAKRYDKAIEKLRSLHDNYDTVSTLIDIKKELEEMFPELKESEGERLRKYILSHLQGHLDTAREFTSKGISSPFSAEEIKMLEASVAWLEKKCKQKISFSLPTEGEFPYNNPADTLDGEIENIWEKLSCDNKFTATKDGFHEVVVHFVNWYEKQGEKDLVTCPICGWEIKKQGEQKSLDDIAKEVTKDKDAAISFLKSTGIINEKGELADEYKIEQDEQNPVWSEEDEDYYDAIISKLEVTQDDALLTDNQMKFLKSLKDRYTWKPSEEQMAVLNEVIKYAANSELQHWNSFIYTLLKSLREQLKKLREE